MIGQEELPLRGALLSALEKAASDAEREGAGRGRSNGTSMTGTDPVRARRLMPSVAAADQVPIAVRVVPGRTGRPREVEKYPFAQLTPVSSNEAGQLSGPCFFIPLHDNPENCVAAAHKRHRGKKFITRKVSGGTMIWRRS